MRNRIPGIFPERTVRPCKSGRMRRCSTTPPRTSRLPTSPGTRTCVPRRCATSVAAAERGCTPRPGRGRCTRSTGEARTTTGRASRTASTSVPRGCSGRSTAFRGRERPRARSTFVRLPPRSTRGTSPAATLLRSRCRASGRVRPASSSSRPRSHPTTRLGRRAARRRARERAERGARDPLGCARDDARRARDASPHGRVSAGPTPGARAPPRCSRRGTSDDELGCRIWTHVHAREARSRARSGPRLRGEHPLARCGVRPATRADAQRRSSSTRRRTARCDRGRRGRARELAHVSSDAPSAATGSPNAVVPRRTGDRRRARIAPARARAGRAPPRRRRARLATQARSRRGPGSVTEPRATASRSSRSSPARATRSGSRGHAPSPCTPSSRSSGSVSATAQRLVRPLDGRPRDGALRLAVHRGRPALPALTAW